MDFIDGLFLPAIAIVSLFVSLGDVFNFFHLIPVNQVSMVILVLVSMMLGALAFIQNKCNEMQHLLKQILLKAEQEQLKESLAHISPNLLKVVGDDYFSGMFDAMDKAIEDSKIYVNDSNNFRLNFKRMLRSFPSSTFLSTSSLATSYLWNEKDMEDALTRFIHEGGKINQVFFVRSAEEGASKEMQVTLDLLKKIGITVRIIQSEGIPAHLKRYFIVESHKKIGWDIPINDQGHVGLSVITANETATTNYCKMFEMLWESDG